MSIAHIFEMDGDKLRQSHVGYYELLLDQLQQDQFATVANPGHYLDPLRADKRANAAHVRLIIGFAASFFVNGNSASHLQLKSIRNLKIMI